MEHEPTSQTAEWWGVNGLGRLPFLDWLRGLACILMLATHVFDAYLRGPSATAYWPLMESICAPVFLFLMGATLAFRMGRGGMRSALRRAAWLAMVALAYQLFRWALARPRGAWTDIFRADVLNSMALAAAVMAPWALLPAARRIRYSAMAGLVIAVSVPLVSGKGWSSVPLPIRAYLVPSGSSFSFFPFAAYVHVGFSLGTLFWHSSVEAIDHAVQWVAIFGFSLVLACLYFPSFPHWLYSNADYGDSSPAAVFTRMGIVFVLLALAFVAASGQAASAPGIVRTLGTSTLLIYWVHMEVVYGRWFAFAKGTLSVWQCGLAAAALVLLMLGLAWLRRSVVPAR